MITKRITEISLKFPYLTDDPSPNGLKFIESVRSTLDSLINGNTDRKIVVTLYPSRSEHNYAISSSLRYATVDPMFQIGTVKKYYPEDNTMVLDVDSKIEQYAMNSLRVVPRAIVKIVDGTEKCSIVDLINLSCIDIVAEPEEESNE